jgi:hypothetical protein
MQINRNNINKIRLCTHSFFSHINHKYIGYTSNTLKYHSTLGHNEDETKESFILRLWITDFPAYSELTYEKLILLSSQSNKIGKWMSEANIQYQNFIDTPKWIKMAEGSEFSWSQERRDKLIEAKKLASNLSLEKNRIALESRKKLLAANDNYRASLITLFKDEPYLIVEFFTNAMLPIETIVKSYEFKSQDEAKEYLAKELAKFKSTTFSRFNRGEISTQELLDILDVQ